MKSSSSRLYIGTIGRAVGLRGEVEVAVESDAPDRFASGNVVEHGDRQLVIRSSRLQGRRTIIAFDGITDRTASELLRGAELSIPSDQARELEEGEFWDHDLIGCTVVTKVGDKIGTVTDVLHQPTGEVLVVNGDREYLVPLIKDVVKRIDRGVSIEIKPMKGLLDPD